MRLVIKMDDYSLFLPPKGHHVPYIQLVQIGNVHDCTCNRQLLYIGELNSDVDENKNAWIHLDRVDCIGIDKSAYEILVFIP